jgi:2-oxoglutarate ferredoxin oxidoreductase subunit delta
LIAGLRSREGRVDGDGVAPPGPVWSRVAVTPFMVERVMSETKTDTVPSKKSGKKKPKTPPDIVVKVSWCKACGLCVEYCNRGVLKMEGTLPQVINAERCNWCLMCEHMCPDFALEVKEKETDAESASEDAS